MGLFAGFECADFMRGPQLTFKPTTFHFLALVVLFSEAEFASAAHFLIGVSPFFRTSQNSLRHPLLMIGF